MPSLQRQERGVPASRVARITDRIRATSNLNPYSVIILTATYRGSCRGSRIAPVSAFERRHSPGARCFRCMDRRQARRVPSISSDAAVPLAYQYRRNSPIWSLTDYSAQRP